VGSRRVRTSGLEVFNSCRKLTVCSRDGEKGEVSEELRRSGDSGRAHLATSTVSDDNDL